METEELLIREIAGKDLLPAQLTCFSGRLGPYRKTQPDLRNFSGYFTYLDRGDFIMMCSDGVYDNLDPQTNGVVCTANFEPTSQLQSPKSLGLPDVELWTDLPTADWTGILQISHSEVLS